LIRLRDYQVRAVDAADLAFLGGARSVLVVAPTGAGKGTIAAWRLQAEVARGGRCVFLVHREEIVSDVASRLLAAGCSDVATRSGGRLVGAPDARVQVCSVQTLTARPDARPPATLLVTDEAHHAVAATYRALYAAYPGVPHLGLTATPERSDRTALGDVYDELVTVASVRELTEAGWLVPCDVIAPAKAAQALACSPAEALARYAPKGRALVFCGTKDEARELAAQHGGACVIGETRDRGDVLRAFRRGEIPFLSTVQVLTEGVDVPEAEVVILARGCSSVGMFLQITGRVLRPAPGKARALLVDLRGAVHAHGMPDDDRAFSLTGRAISGKAKGEPIRQCASCGRVAKTWLGACPRCGSAPPPMPAQRVKAAALAKVTSTASEGERRAYFDALCAQARRSGYRPGWVGIRFKGRFGHWPKWPVSKAAEGARA